MTCVGCKLDPAFLAVVVVCGPIFGAGHTSLSRVRFEVWEQRKLRIFQEDQLVRVILKKYPLARRATKKDTIAAHANVTRWFQIKLDVHPRNWVISNLNILQLIFNIGEMS